MARSDNPLKGEAAAILERLEDGLAAGDQLTRLRYLAAAYNSLGEPKKAFPVIERASPSLSLTPFLDYAKPSSP